MAPITLTQLRHIACKVTPVELIQWALQALHGLELSEGASIGALQRVAAVGWATVAEIRATIRASPRVYADETGLRQDGTNG